MIDMHSAHSCQNSALHPPSTWFNSQDLQYDEQVLPGLQELLNNGAPGVTGQSDPFSTAAVSLTHPLSLQDLSVIQEQSLPVPGVTYSVEPFSSGCSASGAQGTGVPFIRAKSQQEGPPHETATVEAKQESADSGLLSSPTGSSNSRDLALPKSVDKVQPAILDKKALAKQRYREKNRKAQARHRERNKRTIEDLTAKVSALTAENSDLRLEKAIVSTLAKAQDENYSILRKAKENLAYFEAESLIAESYRLANGADAEVSPEQIEMWCLQDSAAVRQANIQKVAGLLCEGGLSDITSPASQKLQTEMARKRRLSLRFAVGKPRFVRSLYSWERQYSSRLAKPDFQECWRDALQVMRLSEGQRTQMVHARALLITKMHTILSERRSLVAAAKAGAMEGVADVLLCSLEEERQAVFGFLFTFFDETLTMLQECSCDVKLYPWAPDVLGMSDILMEEAVAASPTGIEGLNLPAHLMPTNEGRLDLDALLLPARMTLKSRNTDIMDVAAAADVKWPPETPFELLSIPVTTRSCGTAGISLLRNVLMFAGGAFPVQLPSVPHEILTRTPILSMIRQQPSQGR